MGNRARSKRGAAFAIGTAGVAAFAIGIACARRPAPNGPRDAEDGSAAAIGDPSDSDPPLATTSATDGDAAAADATDGGASGRSDAAHADAGEGGARKLGPSFTAYDVNHVLVTGQSLSVGYKGMPALSTTQPFANRMFASGVLAEEYGLGALIPLVEGDAVPGTPMRVETPASGFANLVTRLAQTDFGIPHALLVSAHGVSGMDYAGLKKGTKPYALGLRQVEAAKTLATREGRSHVVRAVMIVHGEADSMGNNGRYEAQLLRWQSDYETDVRAITGQAEAVPLFESQMSSFALVGPGTSSTVVGAQLAAHVHAPGRVVLVGPKYDLPYSDGVHLTNEGYRRLGEAYAKVYRRVVFEGATWDPIRPRTISLRADGAIEARFFVPSPPLVFDTQRVVDPGSYGFVLVDDGKPAPIASVAITGDDTVLLRPAGAPCASRAPSSIGPSASTCAKLRLRYAWTGSPGAPGGPRTGPRGNLRDSDTTPATTGPPLANWCVHFDEPVTPLADGSTNAPADGASRDAGAW